MQIAAAEPIAAVGQNLVDDSAGSAMELARANDGFETAVWPVSYMVGCNAAVAVVDDRVDARLVAPVHTGFAAASDTQLSSILAETAVDHTSCRQSAAAAYRRVARRTGYMMRFVHNLAAGLLRHAWPTGCTPEGTKGHADAMTACIASSAVVAAAGKSPSNTSVDWGLWGEVLTA